MDALISLPVLSWLVIPSFGAYSTSLNLLFFYMTWATLVLSHPPLRVELVGCLAIRLLFYVVPSTLFFLFDCLIPSLSVSIKIQGPAALPVPPARRRRVRSVRAPRSSYLWAQVLGLSLANIVFGLALQAGVELLFTDVFRIRSALKVTTSLPFPWAIAKDIGRGYLLREIFQYYIHRYALHQTSNPLAQGHQCLHHSMSAPYSFVAHYDNPLSWVLWRFIPVYGPAVVFRFHLLTYFIFLATVSVEECLTYSGYSTVPSLILGGISKRTDLHMETGGEGNFAPWGLLDWISGTSAGQDIGDDVREELEKHDVGERVGESWDAVKGGVREGVREKSKRRRARKDD
ncbi:MAG: hypothetical protein M1824_002206 [Vezdaea acicularis]|nr:MAG: hypothetical protein M1824_002206 [Vezdaea acicularis]